MQAASRVIVLAAFAASLVSTNACDTTKTGSNPSAETGQRAANAPAAAEWTVMVYMNGKNNLEPDAISNFLQMAEVGSTDQVNILVEFGRPKKHYTDDFGGWSKTLRFKVTKGMEPLEASAVEDLGIVDMGKGKQAASFLTWAKSNYPAKRYMFVVWDHGQGWRFKNSRNFEVRALAARATSQEPMLPQDEMPRAPYRAISNDDDFGTVMYNRDLQDSLAAALGSARLDIIGFDACLMAMIETAYAMRNVGRMMVASEELEPGTGWNYRRWLEPLVANPLMDAKTLSKSVVDAYKAEYGDIYMTTLSAIDLSNLPAVITTLNSLAMSLDQSLTTKRAAIRTTRKKCKSYGTAVKLTNPIDIGCFVDQVVAADELASFREQARAVRQAVDSTVTANYASKRMIKGFGSFGLSFYFPADLKDHRKDPDHTGYESGNTLMPVEYVHTERWAPFLWSYLGLPIASASSWPFRPPASGDIVNTLR